MSSYLSFLLLALLLLVSATHTSVRAEKSKSSVHGTIQVNPADAGNPIHVGETKQDDSTTASDKAKSSDSDDVEDAEPPVAPKPLKRTDVTLPEYMTKITEGDTARLINKYDIVVMFVYHTSKEVCPSCEIMYEFYQNTSETFVKDRKGRGYDLLGRNEVHKSIKFSALDMEEEAEEFLEVTQMEQLGQRQLPLIVIFKKDQHKLGMPPIAFTVSDQMAYRLPRFLLRLVGTSPAPVISEKELFPRLSHTATERVSIGIWMNQLPLAVDDVVFRQRLEFLFHQMPSPAEAPKEFVDKYNPEHADVVMYYYKHPEYYLKEPPKDVPFAKVIEMFPLTFNKTLKGAQRNFDHQHRVLSRKLVEWGVLRPGHEFDNIKTVSVINGTRPADCNRTVQKGDRIMGQVMGRVTRSGVLFSDTRTEAFKVGEERVDLPNHLTAHGFLGLCAGQDRQIGFPPGVAYPDAEHRPPGVDARDYVTFYLNVTRFLPDDAPETVNIEPGSMRHNFPEPDPDYNDEL